MMTSGITVVVEGDSDVAAARAVIEAAGRSPGRVFVKRGTGALDRDLHKYISASAHGSYVIIRDSDGVCPVELREELVGTVSPLPPSFQLRIAHAMTEAWLMADHEGFAQYFSVRTADLPAAPEMIRDPKQRLLQICARSRSRTIRAAMVRSNGRIGTGYVPTLQQFAESRWDAKRAASRSPSLQRALERIRQMPL